MIKDDDGNTREIDLDETTNSECSKQSLEVSIIQAPVVFDKFAIRQRITRNVALIPGAEVFHPVFKLEKAEDFRIAKMSVLSNTYLNQNSELKKLELMITIEYNLLYTDGTNRIKQPDKAIFNLVINGINYPDCKVKYFEKKYAGAPLEMNSKNKMNIKVEALAEAFGDVICPNTGALIIEIGAFFMINCECMTQLSIPTYKLDNVLLSEIWDYGPCPWSPDRCSTLTGQITGWSDFGPKAAFCTYRLSSDSHSIKPLKIHIERSTGNATPK